MPDRPSGTVHSHVHEYFGIDVNAVHGVVSTDLEPMRVAVATWLEANPDE